METPAWPKRAPEAVPRGAPEWPARRQGTLPAPILHRAGTETTIAFGQRRKIH